METTIVIPVKNEQKPLTMLLPQIREKHPDLTVVVADNGSTDDSTGVAKQFAHVVLDCGHYQGKPQIIKYFFSLIHYSNGQIIIFDGDGQHPVDAIERMLLEASSHPGRIIKGTRFSHINGYTVPQERMDLCRKSVCFIQEHRGVAFTDPQCGLMLIPAGMVKDFSGELQFDGPSWELELIMYLTAKGKGNLIHEMSIPPLYTDLLGEKQQKKYAQTSEAVAERNARIDRHLAFLQKCLHRW